MVWFGCTALFEFEESRFEIDGKNDRNGKGKGKGGGGLRPYEFSH